MDGVAVVVMVVAPGSGWWVRPILRPPARRVQDPFAVESYDPLGMGPAVWWTAARDPRSATAALLPGRGGGAELHARGRAAAHGPAAAQRGDPPARGAARRPAARAHDP